jgi:site-specific DNA-methyltransferase (adenine-specific)
MRQIIESSSLVGDTVLDPFLGSGSTAVAAILCGRKIVGIEVDESYAKLATTRIAAAEVIATEAGKC